MNEEIYITEEDKITIINIMNEIGNLIVIENS